MSTSQRKDRAPTAEAAQDAVVTFKAYQAADTETSMFPRVALE